MRRIVAGVLLISGWIFAATLPAKGSQADHWVEARSTHFVVLTNSSEREARRLASQFERMHLVFNTLLPAAGNDIGPPITVLAVKDRKSMLSLEPESYLAKNQMDLAGFFLRAADKNYILIRMDAEQTHAYATVYHEYTHYMLRKADSWLPLWLNEGLAQFYENTDMDDKTVWLGEANADELRFLKRNDLLPLETLLRVDAKSPYYHDEEKGSIFYAESWALTHFLIASDRIQGIHRLHDYCERLAAGEDSVTAARAVFGDLAKLQNGLSDYVMQRTFMYFMMPAQLNEQDANFVVRTVSSTDANAIRADLMAYTGRADDARTLAEQVLAQDPKNALAHETLGLLRFRAGDLTSAERWYDEAVTLNPQSYLALYYSATLRIRAAAQDDPDLIESRLHASIRLNPEFAPAYDSLAMFYAIHHRNLDEAHALNLQAIALEPARLSYRLNCAEVLVEQRHFDEALGVLKEAMRLARTPAEIQAVSNGMVRVEHYQTAIAASTVKP